MKLLLPIIVVVTSLTSESIWVPGKIRTAPSTLKGPKLPVFVSAKTNAGELLPAPSVRTSDALIRPLAKAERFTSIDVVEVSTMLPLLTISFVFIAESSKTILKLVPISAFSMLREKLSSLLALTTSVALARAWFLGATVSIR